MFSKEMAFSTVSLFISRLVIGLVFVASGWGKFQKIDEVAKYFSSLGIPFASLQAPFVAGAEFLAGLLILVGYKARIATLPLIFIMLVAIGVAKYEVLEGVSSLLELSEFLYIVLLLSIFAQKSDLLTLDSWKERRTKDILKSDPRLVP